jgi:CDP-6-deoxy-D-xylo-4-hexulose-3-dehydrase
MNKPVFDEKRLREEIIEKGKAYFSIKKNENKILPGVSYIPASGKVVDEEDLAHLVDASLDMWLTAGRYSDVFEKDLSAFIGAKYSTLVNSGSSANLVAITALTSYKLGNKRLKAGDEIITVAAGFPTTVAPIIQNGLIPVFVDVELGTYNIKIDELEKAISNKTKAIFIAHTLGNPFDVSKIMEIAKKYELWLIEDNCDALGSKYDGKFTGTFGHISTFSFYPAHHITMGEGGAVVTNDSKLNTIIHSIRDWGRDCVCPPGKDDICGHRFSQQHGELPWGYDHKYVYSHFGYNLKVTDMQAALGVSQLKKLPGFIDKRRENYQKFYNGLMALEDYMVLPNPTERSEPSWFGFALTLKQNDQFDRNRLIRYLEERRIGTRLLFAGNMIKQPLFTENQISHRVVGSLVNTDIVMNRTFWIGLWPGIDNETIDYVINCFKQYFK